jgi:magnesium chelatase subunit D
MKPVYPWSAVIGQSALKHALLLCAIDPGLGGVLVQGPRGVAKTTLARALAELVSGAFVELPLGATEERVTGTLDLGAALREGRVQFLPGLLAKAHDGVLYVDEINLLPDPLVDLLLDAAATGTNTVERDGVSHVHAARFVLVGTMNPEEGELRPQLIDRFGLSVVAQGEIRPPERAAIVTHRLAFDRNPAAFVASFAAEQQALVERCRRARARAEQIPLDGPGLERVTQVCHAARVEGVRADLAMLRAARAHAAWYERLQISSEDVDAVAELALAHRRRAEPPRPGPGPQSGAPSTSSGASSPSSAGDGSRGGSSASDGDAHGESAPNGAEGSRGALLPIPVRAGAAPKLPSRLVRARGRCPSTRRYGAPSFAANRGSRAPGSAAEGAVDWFQTLAHLARRTPGGRAEPLSYRAGISRRDLRYRARHAAPEQLWIVALDCSSSMLRGGALVAAKGVAHALENSARRAGAQMALIAFRGPSARTELAGGAGRRIFADVMSRLGGGGGTPLRAAIQEALAVCARRAYRSSTVAKRLLVLTDGRTRESMADLAVSRPDLELFVIDCERAQVRLGRARTIATSIGATYLHVDTLT